MRDVPLIRAGYEWMDEAYQAAVGEAVRRQDSHAVARLGERRDILERGIFVLLFGQFEKEVTARFSHARDSRSANPDWNLRRGWDAPELAGNRVKFETRLSMILDRRAPEYGAIIRQYQLRNHCAHGGTSQPVGSIDQ